jgi:hypothetical protein
LDHPPLRCDFETNSVTVTAEIAREIAERPFQRLKVNVVGVPKAKSTPAEVDVRLTCPPDVARGLRADQVVPLVTVDSKESQGSLSLPVVVKVDRCEAHIVPDHVVVRW